MIKAEVIFRRVIIAAVLVWIGNSSYAAANKQSSAEFEMQELFKLMRGPNIVVAVDGSVLAFGDWGQMLRRSEDGGKTWSKAQRILEEVVDDTRVSAIVDENNGHVMVVDGISGNLWRSLDHGKSWEREKIIFRSNALGHGIPGKISTETGGSESGITLRYGKHKGRLVMPVRVNPPSNSNDQESWMYFYNTAIYSDNGGRSWKTAGPVQNGTGEGTLAEMSDGAIYYNSRSHMAIDHRRQIAWSYDGGHMWTDWKSSKDLLEVGEPHFFRYGKKPSYGCAAGLVRLPLELTDGKDVLLYSAPDNPGGIRKRMTVWASFDRGETWPVKRLVYEGLSSYSSLTADSDGNIYLLFEWGKDYLYESIYMAKFNLEWVMENQ